MRNGLDNNTNSTVGISVESSGLGDESNTELFFIWPLSTYFEFYYKSKQTPRGIAYAIVKTTIQILVPAILFLGSIKLVGLVVSFLPIQILLVPHSNNYLDTAIRGGIIYNRL